MMYPGAGLGGTAQRIMREETPETESGLPLKQAVFGALAADALVLLLVGALLCAGPLLPFPVAVLAFGLVWKPLRDRYGGATSVAVGVGLLLSAGWLTAVGRGLIQPGAVAAWAFATRVASPLFRGAWWQYALLSLGWVVGFAAPKGWKRRAAHALTATGVGWWLALGWRPVSGAARLGADMWTAVQAVAVPMLLAAAPFALALATRNWIEVLVGSTWPPQFDKVSISKEGILGLVAPWLTRRFQNPHAAPAARDSVEVTLLRTDPEAGRPVRQTTRFPRPPRNPGGLSQFAQAIGGGLATFSQKGSRRGGAKGAIHFGYTQEGWYDLREAFVSTHLADRMPDGSARLNEDGRRFLEAMATRATPPLPPGEEGLDAQMQGGGN